MASQTNVSTVNVAVDAPPWAQQLVTEINRAFAISTAIGIRPLGPATVKAALPTASKYMATSAQGPGLVWVSDAATGAVYAYSNGVNWLRIDTNAIIT